MKKLFTLLALAASITVASAQTQPAKPVSKTKTAATAKKECKKGDKCCSMKEKTACATKQN